MKSNLLKSILPHGIAIAIFLLVSLIFCKDGLNPDLVLKQGDITGWQGMSHQSYVYKETHGHLPLWITSMFSGMPAYQVAIEGDWSPLGFIDQLIQLWLPQPMNFFFLACLGFYFLCICLRIRPWASIIGALGFAYCSFSPIIVTAGHNTQMLALAYAPAVIGAVILVLDKKYLSGFILTALLTALQIGQGHQQISYYLFLILLILVITYAIRLVRTGEMAHLVKSAGILLIAGILGIASNAINLLPTYDYAPQSKRGGQLVMKKENNARDIVKDGKTTGLSKDYAFMWSYGKAETFSLMFPGVQGYGLHYAQKEGEQYIFPELGPQSATATYFTETLNVPEDQAAQYAQQQSGSIYWGDQPFTNGPVYLGAIICFFFILGMFLLDNKHKWWIFSASILGILLSWGSNFQGFNDFMFDHFPLYNKFRVPTMALVIPQILFPIMASLLMERWMSGIRETDWKPFIKGAIATGLVIALALAYYSSADFSKENKARTTAFNRILSENAKGDPSVAISELNNKEKAQADNQLYEGMVMNFKGNPEAQKMGREFITAVRKDRASFFLADIGRSTILILICAGLVALYLRKTIAVNFLLAGATILAAFDLLGFGMKYLNSFSYDDKASYENREFPISKADEQILQDKDPNFRVFNTSGLDESRTSYHHKSIGGYHPAKLGIYDDLMAYQLTGQPNLNVVNMLNAKWIIQRQGDESMAMQNPGALGNVWFVKNAQWVKGPVAEMQALNDLNTKDSAVIDESYRSAIPAFTAPDSTASIRQVQFDNDAIRYESQTNGAHLAVFSEIYYKDWKAYLDGREVPYAKANYVLRSIVVPAGKHTIEFKFEPATFYTGKKISTITCWLIAILLLGWIGWQFKNAGRKQAQSA